MPKFIETTIEGIEWMLLGDRGLYWHDQRTLLVADTHLGKEATFRRAGLPVPRGSTNGTLQTVSRMLLRTEATSLIILGDMFHTRSSLSRDVRQSLEHFFTKHSDVQFKLVRGNHDAHVGRLPTHWPIEVAEPGTRIGEVELSHEPGVPDRSKLMLCGHLHPSIQCDTPTERLGKLPCFWLHESCLVLPAIGEFTGTHSIKPNKTDRAWMVLGEELMEYHHDLVRK